MIIFESLSEQQALVVGLSSSFVGDLSDTSNLFTQHDGNPAACAIQDISATNIPRPSRILIETVDTFSS
jgi:hypothetical protein